MKSKIKQLVLLVWALTVSFTMQAADNIKKDTDANIYGHVIEQKSGEHLPYVSILVKGTAIGTTTDASGHYFLKNLPEGTFTIEAKFVGYKTAEKRVTVKKKRDQTQDGT